MPQPRVIEGTTEEVATLLRGEAFAGRKVRVIISVIEPDEEDFSDALSDLPNSVRDADHLERLLLEGLASPAREMTESDWQQLHRLANCIASPRAGSMAERCEPQNHHP